MLHRAWQSLKDCCTCQAMAVRYNSSPIAMVFIGSMSADLCCTGHGRFSKDCSTCQVVLVLYDHDSTFDSMSGL